eukprot:13378677-Alexandrium_andersonii.AAC.1
MLQGWLFARVRLRPPRALLRAAHSWTCAGAVGRSTTCGAAPTARTDTGKAGALCPPSCFAAES